MGLITISGQPGCRTEEVARIAAQLLGFEIVTESRLNALLPEEFGTAGTVPERAWRDLMLALTGPLAATHHLILSFDGAEQLAQEFPGSLRVHIVAPEAVRAGNLMVDRRMERAPARASLAERDRERKAVWKKRFGRVSAGPDAYDLVLNAAALSKSRHPWSSRRRGRAGFRNRVCCRRPVYRTWSFAFGCGWRGTASPRSDASITPPSSSSIRARKSSRTCLTSTVSPGNMSPRVFRFSGTRMGALPKRLPPISISRSSICTSN